MWALIAKLIPGLASIVTGPLVTGFVDGYKAKLEAGNNKDKIAADLAGRELLVQQREIEVQYQLRQAQIGKWYTVENLCGYVIVFTLGKVYIWDAAFHLGTTDPVKGSIAEWGGLVIMFFFGKRAIDSVAQIIKGFK